MACAVGNRVFYSADLWVEASDEGFGVEGWISQYGPQSKSTVKYECMHLKGQLKYASKYGSILLTPFRAGQEQVGQDTFREGTGDAGCNRGRKLDQNGVGLGGTPDY